jgi:hypothetical protein
MMQANWRFFAFLAGLPLLSLSSPAATAANDADSAYFCSASRSYYPAVAACAVPWTTIPRRTLEIAPAPSKPVEMAAAALPPLAPAPAAKPAPVALEVMPAERTEASIALFAFGPQQHPIECAALQICDLSLQAGEQVRMIKIGDMANWTLDPARAGDGPNEVEHIFISARNKGLDSSAVIMTSRRTYHLRLTSLSGDYMSQISFSYEGETPPQSVTAPPEAPAPAPTAEPGNRGPSAQLLNRHGAGDGFVTVAGTVYIKGREPHGLGDNKGHSLPQAVQLPSVSEQLLSFDDPTFASKPSLNTEPPLPQAAPRPSVDSNRLHERAFPAGGE